VLAPIHPSSRFVSATISPFVSQSPEKRRISVWIGEALGSSIGQNRNYRRTSMIYALMGYLHNAVTERVKAIRSLAEGERGQGTVEYVGLILLVSLLMVGMVAAMKGFNGKQGTELASLIVNKITEAVDKVAFK
jgi:hypothetical protein